MTGVFDSLSTDMHSNQITSSSYHSLHKSQESPTLPVSTATDSSYYNGQQTGHCAGSPYGQLGAYPYHNNGMNGVQYNAKSYDLGFNSSFSTYAYGSSASPTPTDAGQFLYFLFCWLLFELVVRIYARVLYNSNVTLGFFHCRKR